jgi:hypothetical protein
VHFVDDEIIEWLKRREQRRQHRKHLAATKSIRCERWEYRLTATPSVSHRQSKKTGPTASLAGAEKWLS